MNVLPDGATATSDHQAEAICTPSAKRSGWRAFARSRDGSAAIEFALLAIPYFMVIFAILETFIAFAAEELVSNAVDTMSRKMRTGQIASTVGEAAFRQEFCDEVSILIQCSAAEIATPDKLRLDVRTFSKFSEIPAAVPMNATGLDTSAMQYSPGGSGSINMVRAYYHWQIITDLIRPYITPYRTADGSRLNDYLIVATAAFQNEPY
ncbi:TadE/TadG family type IV pilus assembly protein [Rhizobium sullae]|uniref:Flp pilus assembly protein TadG n=1 Tax=Rhizobium sullae TaxID=50338 RepID=A0A4R3QA54_RHISU|nr:TadE/TadG family type IV pilus assembly protein [Rhizobium sullae]TCU18340.1 Flp pilus assembly protein TadG [Rhizobium sullae]